ncbi:hypothetical protein LINGRAHAP2_LOCUS33715, partial [Linum grandiflorum]
RLRSGYCNPLQLLFDGSPRRDACHAILESLRTSMRGYSQPYLPRSELCCGLSSQPWSCICVWFL